MKKIFNQPYFMGMNAALSTILLLSSMTSLVGCGNSATPVAEKKPAPAAPAPLAATLEPQVQGEWLAQSIKNQSGHGLDFASSPTNRLEGQFSGKDLTLTGGLAKSTKPKYTKAFGVYFDDLPPSLAVSYTDTSIELTNAKTGKAVSYTVTLSDKAGSPAGSNDQMVLESTADNVFSDGRATKITLIRK